MQMLKVLINFEAILFTFSRIMLSLKSSLKLTESKWEKVIILLLLLPCLCPSMGYILIWNALKGYLGEKTRNFFLLEPLFCMLYMKFLSKCLCSKEPVLPCAPTTLVLSFQPNFRPNIYLDFCKFTYLQKINS